MKKIVALLLAAVLLVTSLSITSTAKNGYDDNGYPIVLVPGYASASLEYVENGETHSAWGWKPADLTNDFANKGLSLLRGIDLLFSGNMDYLIRVFADGMSDLLESMECNPDGTSKKNVRPVLFDADETNDKYMNAKYPDGDYRVELDMTKALDSIVGEENVFYFNCDFRMSAVECAEVLDEYITQVKEFTGKDKVNIVAVSHGGLITSTYLALYMQKQDVFNVVMDEPALAGAGLASDFLNNNIILDEESLVRYLEYHSQSEIDFNWIVKAQQFDIIDEIAKKILPSAIESVKYWGSLWDLVPLSEYEQLKKIHLDETQSAELIAQSDYVHYQIMGNYRKIFADAKSLGVNVNIIAGAGHRIVTGTDENSDGIITVSSSTGATCAPYGKRFADGYVQKESTGKRMISPSMDIDASTCYLPYNTWFVNGLYHGMEFWDEYSRTLLFTLLTTKNPIDVNTDKNYPRFHDTTSVTSSVYACFNESERGFLNQNDTALTVTNLSSKYNMMILDVRCDGAEIDFDWKFKLLSPGESMDVEFDAKLPQGMTYSSVKVTYFLFGSATPLNQREQNFTIMNGEAGENTDGYESTDFITAFESKASAGLLKMFDKMGLTDLANAAYDAASSSWKRVRDLFV